MKGRENGWCCICSNAETADNVYWPALDINGLDNLDSYTPPFQPVDVDLKRNYGLTSNFQYPGNNE